MQKLVDTLVLNVFISCGVILGGTLMGSLGAVFTGRAPGYSMLELADKLKIWALVAAMGGTFDTLKAIETGILVWQLGSIAKQVLLILSSFVGAHVGYLFLVYLAGGGSR